jgi:hypothetical protein
MITLHPRCHQRRRVDQVRGGGMALGALGSPFQIWMLARRRIEPRGAHGGQEGAGGHHSARDHLLRDGLPSRRGVFEGRSPDSLSSRRAALKVAPARCHRLVVVPQESSRNDTQGGCGRPSDAHHAGHRSSALTRAQLVSSRCAVPNCRRLLAPPTYQVGRLPDGRPVLACAECAPGIRYERAENRTMKAA